MIVRCSSDIVGFRPTSNINAPSGQSILDGQPVDKLWSDLSIVSCLIEEVHAWMVDNEVSYSFSYVWDMEDARYTVDIPDHKQAVLFKLTWGGSPL